MIKSTNEAYKWLVDAIDADAIHIEPKQFDKIMEMSEAKLLAYVNEKRRSLK